MIELAAVQLLISGILGLFPQIRPGIRSFIESLTAQIPDLVSAGTDLAQFVNREMDRIRQMIAENRDPTQEEWDALNLAVDNEMSKLDAQAWTAPLPGPSNLPLAVPPVVEDVGQPSQATPLQAAQEQQAVTPAPQQQPAPEFHPEMPRPISPADEPVNEGDPVPQARPEA
jgi:hypothetical protein